MGADREWHQNVGDHRLITIPTATTTVTFNMASALSSSSDTETNKYFDNLASSVIQFDIVADQDILITGMNGTTLTDAISVNGNASYQEDRGNYSSVTIRTTAANTTVSLRAR